MREKLFNDKFRFAPDSLRLSVEIDDIPNLISDTTFITKKFEDTGYEKRIIIKSDYTNLNRIF